MKRPSPCAPLASWAPLAATLAAALAAGWTAAAKADVPTEYGMATSSDIGTAYGLLESRDEDVLIETIDGVVVLDDLGPLPDASDVDGFHLAQSGDRYFSLDTTTLLQGPVLARPDDVVVWDGAAYSIVFDGEAAGVPPGVNVDAVGVVPGALLLSFDTTVLLSGIVFMDEDVARHQGGSFSMHFDGSAEGLDERSDLDGLHQAGPNSGLALSLDAPGEIGGVGFDDADVIAHQGVGQVEVFWDTSAHNPNWEPADTDAISIVPEPAELLAWIAGIGLLTLLGRRRACGTLALGALLALQAPAEAGGRLEINQQCAEGAGCVPGDTPGFPVEITVSGSYALTGDLTVPDANTTAIELVADRISLDMRGFSIRGPVECPALSQEPAQCNASGTGTGILAQSPALPTQGHEVRNGVVIGMGAAGVDLRNGTGSLVLGVRAEQNAGIGIAVGWHSIVEGSVATVNGGAGIHAGRGSVIVDSASNSNTGDGFGTAPDEGLALRRFAASHNGGHGVNLLRSGAVVADGSLRNAGLEAIHSDASSIHHVILRNRIEGAGARGILATRSLMHSNHVSYADSDGISTNRGLVRNNTIRDCDGDGLEMFYGTFAYGNAVAENDGWGIRATSSTSFIQENTVFKNTTGQITGPSFGQDNVFAP